MVSTGNSFQTPSLQPGWKIRINPDGTLSGSATFAVDVGALEDAIPKNGTEHPKNRKLKSISAVGSCGEGGLGKIEVEYLGLTAQRSETKGILIPGMAQEPIQTHPDFSEVIAGTPDAPLNGAEFDPDTGEFLGFPSNSASVESRTVGMTGYFRPTAVWREWFFTSVVSDIDMSTTGTIKSPTSLPKGLALPEGANWLAGPPVPEEFGPFWKVTRDFMLSGPGGWNELVYKRHS